MDPVFDTTIRIALAGLFAWAGWHKLRDAGDFRETLAGYRLVPAGALGAAATAVVIVEIALAGCLPFSALRTGALTAAISLLAVYSAAIGVNLLRGRRHIDCGCSGAAQAQPLSEWLLLRNALLIGLAGLALQTVEARPAAWLDGVAIAGGVLFGAASYAAMNQLIANAPAHARLRLRS